MEAIQFLIDFILHIDKHLLAIVQEYNTWTYLILFAIVFCETGFVITPFLPGDSLLFAAGAIAAQPNTGIDIVFLILLLIVAAVAGDFVNYNIGKFIGPKVFEKNYKLLNKKYLEQAKLFFEKHGRITIVIARFIPIIRTFAPFVAGVGSMKYSRYITFCVIGAVLWVSIITLAGYFLGNVTWIKENIEKVCLGIIFISVLPMLIGLIKSKMNSKNA